VPAPDLSVVIPVCNEQDNVVPLAREIVVALAGRQFEILFVDDGSTDATLERLRGLRTEMPQLRVLRHSRRSGQCYAVASGVRAAAAEWVATLDGDGQNDPADIPALLAAQAAGEGNVRLVMGNRAANRRDTWLRRLQSSIANGVRASLLKDDTADSGCGIKLLHRPTFLALPFFNHMHRFMPALYRRQGAVVLSVPVNHRPRLQGTSKYGLLNRLWVGVVDILGVMWLQSRFAPGLVVEEDC
jgi:dolichol-phosphate mannosyltransferase